MLLTLPVFFLCMNVGTLYFCQPHLRIIGGKYTLVPRLHPAFQCWMLKIGRAWFSKSHAVHHSMVTIMNVGGIKPHNFDLNIDHSKRAWEQGPISDMDT